MELVDAYLARRALDYLVGFSLSPVLWRKLPGAKSAGRVQSVALRLIVDREVEIDAFQTREYWSVEADVSAGSDPFLARLTTHDGKKLARYDLPDEASALAARSAVQAGSFTVSSVERSPPSARPRRPSRPPPCSRRPRAARLQRPAHHERRAEALRGRRRERWPDHLHADRRRAAAPEASPKPAT